MAGDLVLLTGGSGHLGYRVLVRALEQGYHVRATVRSESKASVIKNAPSVQPYLDQLTFATVPDILADGAHDEAVKGVKYILHSASPLAITTDDYQRDIINPAVQGTVGILKSAAKEKSVKRVVITSSVVAIIPFKDMVLEDTDEVFTANSRITPSPTGPYFNSFHAYCAAKTLALEASLTYMKSTAPGFDLINVMPSFIIGSNELITAQSAAVSGTNSIALGPILGKKSESPMPGTVAYLDDIARVEVLSLDEKIAGGQDFIINAKGRGGNGFTEWNEGLEIVKGAFPDAVSKGLLPLGGDLQSKKVFMDVMKTEETFGFKLANYDTMVKDVVQQYLDLGAKA